MNAPSRPETASHPGRSTGPSPEAVSREIARHSYCVLATASADGVPHAVSVLYVEVDGHLYVATGHSTKKARNVGANPRVAVTIPVRKYPVGPPFSVQFQGTARLLERDDPEVADLLASGKLRKVVGYGVLKEADLCFIKITPARRVHTYGLGIPLRRFLRDVVHADRTVELARGPAGSP